jgi:hypothetical protein
LICNKKKCHYPEDFIAALIDSGHKVQVCPRATVAQFGISLCVKESDGLFSNILLSCQLRTTGVERTSDGRQAYFPAPHGGLAIGITGPLIGTSASCDMQFYVDLKGLTAVYENQNVDVPWLKRTSLAGTSTLCPSNDGVVVCCLQLHCAMMSQHSSMLESERKPLRTHCYQRGGIYTIL